MIRKINDVINLFIASVRRTIAETAEEFRTIARNRNYAKKYPKLFAIFAVLEHEQSPQVFELNHDDFSYIKEHILKDEAVNNHHILEALRAIFQNNIYEEGHNEVKDKIVKYLFNESSAMIAADYSYYAPLIKAIVRGFPFLLNHNNYEILRKILRQKKPSSLKLFKYILENEPLEDLFLQKSDAATILIAARDLDNKAAFMLLMRYLRKNNLFEVLFDNNSHFIKSKITNISAVKSHGLDYSAVMLAYHEDKWFIDENIKNDLEKFLYDVFSHHLGLPQKQKFRSYNEVGAFVIRAHRIGYQNSFVIKALENVAERFIDKKTGGKKIARSTIAKYTNSLKKFRPATDNVKIMSFFAVAPLSPEDHWLLRFAPYLL